MLWWAYLHFKLFTFWLISLFASARISIFISHNVILLLFELCSHFFICFSPHSHFLHLNLLCATFSLCALRADDFVFRPVFHILFVVSQVKSQLPHLRRPMEQRIIPLKPHTHRFYFRRSEIKLFSLLETCVPLSQSVRGAYYFHAFCIFRTSFSCAPRKPANSCQKANMNVLKHE